MQQQTTASLSLWQSFTQCRAMHYHTTWIWKTSCPKPSIYSPGSAEVLAGPAAAFDAKGLKWHFDAIEPDWNCDRKVLLRFNATSHASPGEEIFNNAKITWTSHAGSSPEERTGEGGINDYLRSASAQVNAMELSIGKTADPNPAKVGEPLSYTLTLRESWRRSCS